MKKSFQRKQRASQPSPCVLPHASVVWSSKPSPAAPCQWARSNAALLPTVTLIHHLGVTWPLWSCQHRSWEGSSSICTVPCHADWALWWHVVLTLWHWSRNDACVLRMSHLTALYTLICTASQVGQDITHCPHRRVTPLVQRTTWNEA